MYIREHVVYIATVSDRQRVCSCKHGVNTLDNLLHALDTLM